MEIVSASELLKFAAALVFVLALMGGLALVMRRLNDRHGLALPGKRRLKIVESLSLDTKRRLVLLRRDDREHLVILGANGETLIESGIESRQDGQSNPPGPDESKT